jgi:hypothetical protein
MLASVGECGLWTYYMYTGDKGALEHAYPGVMRYLHLWKTENGLAVGRKGGWDWGDWGDDIDMPVLTNAWYYLALRGALLMAQTLELEADARSILIKMEAVEKAFDPEFWNGSAYRSRTYTGDTDDRANALAVVAGLVPRERYGAVREVLSSKFHASTFMEKYVLEALFMMGYDEDALKRMKSRFAAMVDGPLTTLWEGWEIGSQTYGGGLTLLSQYSAGVFPSLPGYEEFHVMPHEGNLSRITSTVPSPKGMISVSIRISDDSYSLGVVPVQRLNALCSENPKRKAASHKAVSPRASRSRAIRLRTGRRIPFHDGDGIRAHGEMDGPPLGPKEARGMKGSHAHDPVPRAFGHHRGMHLRGDKRLHQSGPDGSTWVMQGLFFVLGSVGYALAKPAGPARSVASPRRSRYCFFLHENTDRDTLGF